MSNIAVNEVNGVDIVQYQPEGVCSKLMQIRIKDNIIEDIEIIGGCSGNLTGISFLVRGMDISDVITKLEGISCGSKPTSCPDQLAQALNLYIKSKQTVKA